VGVTEFLFSVPVIPARDVAATADWYSDVLGYSVVHAEPEYGIVERGGSGIHFWGPSGIEPRDSNTMLRVRVEGIDALYADCEQRGVVHPNAALEAKPWGAREFAVVDCDGNLVTFFERGAT
jgi:catechol 2,3-dioxygenase-like lactoylglutathione lyase family enzyme